MCVKECVYVHVCVHVCVCVHVRVCVQTRNQFVVMDFHLAIILVTQCILPFYHTYLVPINR